MATKIQYPENEQFKPTIFSIISLRKSRSVVHLTVVAVHASPYFGHMLSINVEKELEQ